MYLKKNHLGNLLNSLSDGEKRYFFQYVKALNHKESPFYLKLFSQQKSALAPNSEKLSFQTYTKAKKRLYQHLMQCLRHYHQEKSVEIIVQNLLCEIEILYDRGLPEQSLVLLEKAHTKALAHEHYGLVLQILAWERKLNIILDKPKRTSNEIAQEEKKILENSNQIIELENIYSKVQEIKKRHGDVRGAVRQQLEQITIKNPYLSSQYKHASQRGKYYYHFIHSLYYTMVFDTKQAYVHSTELLAPEMQQVLPNEYFEGILEHVTSCLCLGYFKEMLAGLELADTIVRQKKFKHSTSFLIRTFYFQACYKLIMYIYTGERNKLLEIIKETEDQILLDDQLLSAEYKLIVYGNLRNACIAAGAFDKAEKLLEMMLQKESRFVRSDVYSDLFLSRVFSFLSSGTYVLVPSMASSAYRHYNQMKSDENQLEVGLKITAILMKEYNYDDKKVRKETLLKVKEILVQHIVSLQGLNNFQEIYSFYVIWLDSMIQNQPFHIVATEWHARHLKHLVKHNKD